MPLIRGFNTPLHWTLVRSPQALDGLLGWIRGGDEGLFLITGSGPTKGLDFFLSWVRCMFEDVRDVFMTLGRLTPSVSFKPE